MCQLYFIAVCVLTTQNKKTGKADDKGNSLLSLACIAPPGISEKMVQILLSHDKIQPRFSDLSYAVLNYNVKVVKILLDYQCNYNETIASKQQKNDLLAKVLNDCNHNTHGRVMHTFEN